MYFIILKCGPTEKWLTNKTEIWYAVYISYYVRHDVYYSCMCDDTKIKTVHFNSCFYSWFGASLQKDEEMASLESSIYFHLWLFLICSLPSFIPLYLRKMHNHFLLKFYFFLLSIWFLKYIFYFDFYLWLQLWPSGLSRKWIPLPSFPFLLKTQEQAPVGFHSVEYH